MRARGWAALILAVGIAISSVLIVVETILHIGPVSSQEATVLSTVLGAAVGAVATYLGGARPDHPDPPPSSSSDDPRFIDHRSQIGEDDIG